VIGDALLSIATLVAVVVVGVDGVEIGSSKTFVLFFCSRAVKFFNVNFDFLGMDVMATSLICK